MTSCPFFLRVLPPDYVLDFGYVVPGQVLTGVLNVTNSGSVPLSLSANTKCLAGTGAAALQFCSFSVESQCSDPIFHWGEGGVWLWGLKNFS